MKVISYTALHYSKDYLGYAIQSVIDAVDEHWILYTPVGSHGSRTDVPCPDTREELYQVAKDAAGSKLRWVESMWPYEGAQRDSIHQYVPDADAILVLDADEIWPEGLAKAALSVNERYYYYPKRMRVGMIHYWRSFYRAVIHDPAFPERIIFPKAKNNDTILFNEPGAKPIQHMGYAQRPETVEYKILTHGHRSEWRHDVDWFKDKFMANAQTDCHPVGSEYWNPETVDPFTLGLPEFMRNHPYAGMEVIE